MSSDPDSARPGDSGPRQVLLMIALGALLGVLLFVGYLLLPLLLTE